MGFDDDPGGADRLLYDAVRPLVRARTDDAVRQAAVDGASRLLGGATCKLALAEGDELVVAASSASGGPATPSRLPLSDGIVAAAYRRGEPAVVDDLADVRSACARPADARTCRSLLCVPFDEDGLLVATAPVPAAFADEALDRVSLLVADAEAALRRVPAGPDADRLEAVATVLSHDLASPMTVARGYLELAAEPDDREALEPVANALDRVEEMVDGLVSFIRTGRHLGTLDGVELADAARRSWSSTATGDATLELRDSAVILADENGVCELLENLFRNAVEHGSTGSRPVAGVATVHGGDGVAVSVGLLASGDGFYVEDDGPGIPADQRGLVFEDGYTEFDGGTGYGLGIVRRLAEAHGWDLELTAGRDGGARFEVSGVERPPA